MTTPRRADGPQPVRDDAPIGVASELLTVLARAAGPVTITALQAQLGGHPNRFRAPLERLVNDGFVTETSVAATGRGRPARAYTATPSGAQVALEHPGRHVYVALVEAVADSLRTRPDPPAAARDLGRSWGERLPGTDVVPALAAQGFSPVTDGDQVLLRTCPMIDAARRDPAVVCSIHQGMLDAIGEGDLTLVPFASPAGCLVRRGVKGSGRGRDLS